MSTVRKIVPGTTTIIEVEQMLGTPQERVTGANGKTVARYYFREPRLNNHVDVLERRDHPGDVLLRTLTLLYGPGKVIERKLHDESVTAVRRYNARYVMGPTLLPAHLLFLKKGKTTKAELIERLGEPASTSFNSDGSPVLVWLGGSYRPQFVADRELRRMIVELNTENIVRDFVIVESDFDGLLPTEP